MRFTWDPAKARAKFAKHGVSFEEAASALLDPLALEAPDMLDPERTIVLGMSVIQEAEALVRIITARRASALQRRKYEEAP